MNSLISDSLDPLLTEGDGEEFSNKGCEEPSLSRAELEESGFFEDVISANSGEAEVCARFEPLIATESDMDFTAQLVPSGGLQSHPHVTTLPVSETRPQADCRFQYTFSCGPCIYTEAGPVHSVGHNPSLCEDTPSRSSNHVKGSASSTVPFSFGTSPKPGLVEGNLSVGNVQGPVGRLSKVRAGNTMEQDDRMFVKVPNFETESSQNENFRLKPGGAGPFPSVPKSQGWIVGTNEEDLYCEACSCDGGSVDMYTDPRQKRDKPVGRTDEDRESQQSASVIFGNSACPDSQLRIDSTSRPIEDTFQPDCPGTATPARQHQTSHKEDLVKKRRRKKKQKDTQPPPDPLIRKSIELACSRIRRDATAHVLDQLRQIYIEGILGNSQFFDLLDSGLVLSNRKREYFMDRMIVTMRDGARLALSRAEHGYISYYRPCVEFHCVQQLGDNWFRVRDKTTGQLVLMKKVCYFSSKSCSNAENGKVADIDHSVPPAFGLFAKLIVITEHSEDYRRKRL
ncbi:uncharacterized protein [Scyliorhinus torazame]|uniref:uncharacterized protein n=1 Tax=Scyliorhinus torazame TaxID=75743 RepID=UPI003B5AF932